MTDDDRLYDRLEAMATDAAPVARCFRGHCNKCRDCITELVAGELLVRDIGDLEIVSSAVTKRVAEFAEHLDYYLGDRRYDYYYRHDSDGIALAAAMRALLQCIESLPYTPRAVVVALDAYDAEQQELSARFAERERQAAEERAEAERRHELAVRAECPYCGAQPGKPCRSAGKDSKGYSKGIGDHRDRYRAACHLFGDNAGQEAAR